MNQEYHQSLENSIREMESKGTLKRLRYLQSPMDARVRMEGKGEIIILSSNNYLGLSNHPQVIQAGREALQHYGAGTASVRFICGTFSIHRELEQKLASFMGSEAALSYVSCWNANTGAIPVLVGEGDVIISDELNHASIIDGVRLSRARRLIYKHADMEELEERLKSCQDAGTRLIVTDGVFSMEGDLAPLQRIVELARAYDAVTLVDDSHGTGVMGRGGRGVAEHFGVLGQVDVITGTLGKALGGAAGGFVASSSQVIELLTQSSRPQIFSNALPATIAASALKAVEVLEGNSSLVKKLHDNAEYLRAGLRERGFHPLDAPSAIIPILVGETSFAIRMSEKLLDEGIFVTGFGYPVVPEGKARLRVQSSAALERADIDQALEAFSKVGTEVGLL
ncbi:MAG: glycine C-acetyltransferase [Spirochaetaceae bacterium]|nr:MAG: glycine C-acetyltransferase [Spirochaetaceae bacterium]